MLGPCIPPGIIARCNAGLPVAFMAAVLAIFIFDRLQQRDVALGAVVQIVMGIYLAIEKHIKGFQGLALVVR
jgi:hypothetical protein